jgi:hypothetical protein
MSNFIFQILAANNDEPGWAQILIFIIVAAFYAISSLLKARSAAVEEKKRRQVQSGQPRPAVGQAKPKPRSRRQMEEFDLQALWKAFEKPAPKAPVKTHLKPDFQRPAPPVEPPSQPEAIMEKQIAAPSAEPLMTERLIYFSDPADLRKAIIYQEILGQPVALREL